MATINMHMKFEIEIPKANLTYAPETMSSTDRRTDGQTDKVNPVYPPSNFVGRGYKKKKKTHQLKKQISHKKASYFYRWSMISSLPYS